MVISTLTVSIGALTFLNAVFLAYIAFQQWKTARDKLRLDLFDRRYAVYRGLMNLFGGVPEYRTITEEALYKFWGETGQKRFLFGQEIRDYMKEVHDKAVALLHADQKLSVERAESVEDVILQEKGELCNWFHEQIMGEAMKKFEPYLSFPHKS